MRRLGSIPTSVRAMGDVDLRAADAMVRRGTRPSAREWFAVNRERVLASRPVLEEAKTVEYVEPFVMRSRDKAGNTVRRQGTFVRKVQKPAVLGEPTFRNVINEKGEHV